MNQNICEIIDVYRNLEHNYKNEILIVLVANVEGKTNDYDDYERIIRILYLRRI